jgi:hypothetical protein
MVSPLEFKLIVLKLGVLLCCCYLRDDLVLLWRILCTSSLALTLDVTGIVEAMYDLKLNYL